MNQKEAKKLQDRKQNILDCIRQKIRVEDTSLHLTLSCLTACKNLINTEAELCGVLKDIYLERIMCDRELSKKVKASLELQEEENNRLTRSIDVYYKEAKRHKDERDKWKSLYADIDLDKEDWRKYEKEIQSCEGESEAQES